MFRVWLQPPRHATLRRGEGSGFELIRQQEALKLDTAPTQFNGGITFINEYMNENDGKEP